MATYIPGVTDYIPQIQPFQPDYNFLSNIMQTRQSRYDSAHKQLSSVYGTLLNSPMLRDENIHKRDEFFKSVDGDIKRIAGLDLSLKQNQEAAMQVFKPFYEDKDMVKDMAWTKNYYSQLQRGEQFKYCTDPDKCGGQYWEGGIKALQYKADEFRKASKDEALNFSNASFTPLVNVMEKAMKSAKDVGFKVSFDHVQGGYIVTDKNGERMVAPLKSFFLSQFGGDPAVMDYYKTQAYIQRKDFIAANTVPMGGEDKATMAYLNQTYQHVSEKIEKANQSATRTRDRVNLFKDALDQKVRKEGVLPSDNRIFDMWNALKTEQVVAAKNKEVVDAAVNNLNSSKNFMNNSRLMGEHLDQLMGFAMLDKEVGNAAKAYADLTAERDIKADPYSLASYQSNLDFQKQVKLKGMDFDIWKEKEKIKAAQQKAMYDRDLGEGHFNGDLPGSRGQATDVIDKDMARRVNEGMLNDLYKGQKASSSQFVSNLANEMRTQFDINSKDPTKQNVIAATADMIFQGTGISGAKIVAGDVKELAKLQTLDLGAASKAYEQAIKTIDPNAGITGELNSDWSRDFWNKTQDQRTAIKDQKYIRGEYIKFLEEQSKNVTNAVMGDMVQKDPTTGKYKAALVATMAEINHNGFLPVLTPGSESANSIAGEFAKNYQGDFGTWDSAYQFAMDNMQTAADQWYAGYKDHAQAFNHADGFGKVSNAKMGGGYTYNMDSAAPSHNNTVRFNELLRNYGGIEDAAIVQFGDAGAINGTDPAAKAIMDQYMLDFNSVDLKKPKENRPKGKYSVQRVAGGDENFMAFTIYPDESWAAKYRGSEKLPGITRSMGAGQPITVFIPKDKANNSYYRDTEFNTYDFMLQKRGHLTLDDHPQAGKIKIEKIGNQIQIHGNLIGVDANGNEQVVPVSTTANDDLDAHTLFDYYNKELANLERWNLSQKQMARQNHGVKNSSDLQKLLTSQGIKLGQ